MLTQPVLTALLAKRRHVRLDATWTTDAAFRETGTVVAAARAEGILAVETQAAARYAFANASGKPVLRFAQVTDQMSQINGGLVKGEADGVHHALSLITVADRAALEVVRK